MCQAKIVDHYNNKYKCLREDHVTVTGHIIYGYGHKKGQRRGFVRTLCKKHAKPFKHELRNKAKKGHTVEFTEEKLNQIN